jgi:hypothetical protein
MFGEKINQEDTLQGEYRQEGQTMNHEQETSSQGPQGPAYQMPPGAHPYVAPHKVDNSRRKSAVLATILSSFPGLGQIYVGYYQTGFTYSLTVAGIIMILSSSVGKGIEPFLGIFLAFFWIFNMIDANRRAQYYNRVLDGQDAETIPEGFPTAGGRGSVPAGVILVLLGVLFILDLNFDVSMEWIEDWWPLALVGFGGWLIYKGRNKSE